VRSPAHVVGAVVIGLTAVLSGQSPDAGAIVGRVRLRARIGGAALASTAYPTRAVSSARPNPLPEIRNVVVYVRDAAFRGAPAPRRAAMNQNHETFVPHVLAVTRGSTIEFPNDDPIYHNVFSLSSASTFNLGRYPTGQSRRQTMTKAGIVKVYCQIHSHMSATILVFDHPYFAIPELDGSFEIPNLPPGDYTVVGWHERVGERTARLRIDAGRPTSIELSLPVDEQP
jgi:plastocyanin